MAVLAGLVVAAGLFRLLNPQRIPLQNIGRGLLALILGAVLVFAADFAVAKRLAWTPGGFALSFGHMLQDGIVTKYLNAHCPDPSLQLCAYKDQLPHYADTWFWGSPLFDRLGRFAGLGPEMKKIALACVVDYPGLQIESAALSTAEQFIDVHTGEGVLNIIWHTYGMIEKFTPQLAPAMHAARQQKGELSFRTINAFQYPLALIAMALLPVLAGLAWRRQLPADIGELSAFIILTLLGNAFVCGALANPHDRYGARMVWLAALVVMLAALAAKNDRAETPGLPR
jgi:hypothetical protein